MYIYIYILYIYILYIYAIVYIFLYNIFIYICKYIFIYIVFNLHTEIHLKKNVTVYLLRKCLRGPDMK